MKRSLSQLIVLTTLATTTALGGTLAFTSTALSDNAQTGYLFPGRAEDLKSGEYWYRSKKIHGSGNQKLGYDLTAVRFDAKTKKWTKAKPGTNGSQNSHWLIYGQPIYAVTGGKIIACWRNAPENPAPGQSHPGRTSTPKTIGGGGNSLLVDIGNNETILYAHFRPGTIPKSLCPIDKVFRTDASDKSESTLPSNNQPIIKAGQFLGQVGNSGRSSNPHLHIHRSSGRNPLPLPFQTAWTKGINTTVDSANAWKPLNNEPLPPGKVAILPPYAQGYKEIARHGIPESKYQFLFNHITKSGYRLAWIDGFNVNGKVYFNAVFRPKNGIKWATFHGLTSAQYQAKFNEYTGAGYRPLQVESYRRGNGIRYAVIFTKQNGAAFKAYHGRSAQQHQQLFDSLTQQGFRPRNISVVSINGQRSYTALYEKTNIGSFVLKSFMTPAQYQQAFNQNKQAGRQVSYLNAYLHNGQPRFTAIWNSATNGSFKARHGLSSGQYQQQWEDNTQQGFLTRIVTGYEQDNRIRFAAVWRK